MGQAIAGMQRMALELGAQDRKRIALDPTAVALDDAVLARDREERFRRNVAVAPGRLTLERAVEEHAVRVFRECGKDGRRIGVVQRLDEGNGGVAHALAPCARAAVRRAIAISCAASSLSFEPTFTMALITGMSSRPRSVRAYSTDGGDEATT